MDFTRSDTVQWCHLVSITDIKVGKDIIWACGMHFDFSSPCIYLSYMSVLSIEESVALTRAVLHFRKPALETPQSKNLFSTVILLFYPPPPILYFTVFQDNQSVVSIIIAVYL